MVPPQICTLQSVPKELVACAGCIGSSTRDICNAIQIECREWQAVKRVFGYVRRVWHATMQTDFVDCSIICTEIDLK